MTCMLHRPKRYQLHYRGGGTSFHIHASVLTFFLCFLVLFHFYCSNARVFEKTLVREFYISYGHTEWNVLSSISENRDIICKQSAIEQNSDITFLNVSIGLVGISDTSGIKPEWGKPEELLC